MCGIVGIWEYGSSSGQIDLSLVGRMRDTMVHRGPDAEGARLFDNGRGAFGFRRLSIVDLSPAGNQPMAGCAGREILLVFNGEIYNHADLRVDLEARGHTYRSHTDTETIVHLYEEYGTNFVDRIEGDFAIAIWDREEERLSLYRDRLGVKPLYYTIQNGRIVFASEIKAIVEHPAVAAEMDETAVGDYLSFLTTPAPATLFKDINKLEAGQRLVITRDGHISIDRYWDAIPNDDLAGRTEDEHCNEILRLLRLSIKKRMMSDVPFGVFLSGGVDSSANVALMSELMNRTVSTFTVGFEGHDYLNELDSARRIGQRYNTDHHEVIIGESEVRKFLPDLLFHTDEPIADPVCVPLHYVSKLARDNGTIVVQVGEGADEIFCGYDKYLKNLRLYNNAWRFAERVPTSLRGAMAGPLTALIASQPKHHVSAELIRRWRHCQPMFWGGAVVFDETIKRSVLSKALQQRLNGAGGSLHAVSGHLDRILAQDPHADMLTQMTYLEIKLRLPELLLMRVDKISMASSVEARVPFLDHELVEYAMSLPTSMKVRGKTGKYILKKALETVLPQDLLYSKKKGFGAPIREWFLSALGQELTGYILTSSLRRREIINYDFVDRMVSEHKDRKADWSFHLWAILNLSLWYDRWIERKQ